MQSPGALDVTLLTSGSPEQLTGGHLYHRRLHDAAVDRQMSVRFVSVNPCRNPFGDVGDVVLVDSLVAASVLPWAGAALRRGTRLAAIVHQPPGGVGQSTLRTAFQRRLDLSLYRRCDLLVVVSTAVADDLVALRLPRELMVIAEPGRDGPTTTGAAPEMRHGRKIAVLSVGNWLPNKGVTELLDSVAILSDGDVTLHLVGGFGGDARYVARVRRRLAQPDLAGRVVVHGAVRPRELAGMYAGCDVFALASHSETYGTVYAEALATGLPIVGWRAGNLPHLVDDGVEGILAEAGDIAGLASGMRRLAHDSVWRAQLSAAARRRGDRLPTWDDTAGTVFAALSRLATRRD